MSVSAVAHVSPEERAAIAKAVADPALTAKYILGSDLYRLQADIMRSVRDNPLTAVKACHASGKTYTAARIVLWWLLRYPSGIVVTTAPTWLQVEKLLWEEIHKAAESSLVDFPALNQTELEISPGRYAIGISTNQAVRFQGFHGLDVLVIMDEAPGVRPDIWTAIDGIRSGGRVHVLALGNPVFAGGPFHDAFVNPNSLYKTFTVSAFDTPNLRGVSLQMLRDGLRPEHLPRASRPYLVTATWVWEMFHKWGEDHPDWQARVMGAFPKQAPGMIYPLVWLDMAAVEEREALEGGRVTAGIDVAGGGEDETALAVVDDMTGQIVTQDAWPDSDPYYYVAAKLDGLRSRLSVVNVDAIGMGYHFARRLQSDGFKVRYVNVGAASSRPKPGKEGPGFYNFKAEIYWHLRELLQEQGVSGLRDDVTKRQLANIKYSENNRGQIVVESKEELAARGVKSPDRAEALILACMPLARGALPAAGLDVVSLTKASKWAGGGLASTMTRGPGRPR